MTKTNLASQISWLLSHDIAPPVGVHTAVPTAPTSAEEGGTAEDIFLEESLLDEDFEEAVLRTISSPPQNRLPEAVNVVQDFVRPALPPTIPPKVRQQEPMRSMTEEAMGKLASASRSTRPGLMGQHQLATPTSTTSTAATCSLRQGYSNFLRENTEG
jgi:bloom syndrome protein